MSLKARPSVRACAALLLKQAEHQGRRYPQSNFPIGCSAPQLKGQGWTGSRIAPAGTAKRNQVMSRRNVWAQYRPRHPATSACRRRPRHSPTFIWHRVFEMWHLEVEVCVSWRNVHASCWPRHPAKSAHPASPATPGEMQNDNSCSARAETSRSCGAQGRPGMCRNGPR